MSPPRKPAGAVEPAGEPPQPDPALAHVLAQFGLAMQDCQRVRTGLIHQTYRVGTPGDGVILQRVHPVFPPEVHRDIDAVTRHLRRRGVRTPVLRRTCDGELWVAHHGLWRAFTLLPGRSRSRISDPRLAAEAGRSLGAFHAALADCEHCFVHHRSVHGIERHAAALRAALEQHSDHRLRTALEPLAESLLALAGPLAARDALPRRILHGDPKISNLLFAQDRAVAWVDLDTVGHLELPVELGDALRSWCNPAGEDGGAPHLDMALLQAALAGYAEGAPGLATPAERERIVDGLLGVCVELGMRFAADALVESYFGWDPSRFPAAGEHNLHRARVQLTLAQSVRKQRRAAERIVHTQLSP